MYSYIYSDDNGDVYVDEEFQALGRSGNQIVEPLDQEMIPMPEGAAFILIPERVPVVSKFDSFIPYPYPENKQIGVILPQGYTRTLLPAFLKEDDVQPPLPLFGYTMAAFKDGKFYVAAAKTDLDQNWNPIHYNTEELPQKINKMKNKFPKNRLIRHLSNCCINYSCFTAQNIFYRRWEGGIPVSPVCNADCLGCISLQRSECCPAPQERITFVPEAGEMAELMVYHLETDESIISFGQGCEGEPSLQADLIAEAIRKTRDKTAKGTINCNTNAGYSEGIKKMVDAGIDSLRVSINSAVADHYQSYYKPKGYSLRDVAASLVYAAEKDCYTYLNLLLLPGVTDTLKETETLIHFIKENRIKEIQFRNLNIDPDYYLQTIAITEPPLGITTMMSMLQQELPDLLIGNYSKPRQRNT